MVGELWLGCDGWLLWSEAGLLTLLFCDCKSQAGGVAHAFLEVEAGENVERVELHQRGRPG
jgi:hypothetical protein